MPEGETISLEELGDCPFDDLIDAEIQLLSDRSQGGPDQQQLEKDQGLKEQLAMLAASPSFDPKAEQHKMNEVVRWAVQDLGANGPIEFLNMMSRVHAGSSVRGMSMIDTLYQEALRSQASQAN